MFDSTYDSYRGVIAYIRVMEGSIKVRSHPTNGKRKEFEVMMGTFQPTLTSGDILQAGDVGYITASIKNVRDTNGMIPLPC